jgi:hypothetical protein
LKRALLAAAGIAAMAAAGLSLLDLDMSGFPDGYVSPYDRATTAWAAGLGFALLVMGIFTLAAAVMSKLGRATVGLVAVLLLAPSLWLLGTCPRLEWCNAAVLTLTGQMIDDGTGG